MISELALEFALLGANVLFLGVNIYAAERYWRRRRRELLAVDTAPSPPHAILRELTESLHTTLRYRAGVHSAAARLEQLLGGYGSSRSPEVIAVEVRLIARELRDLLNRPS